jgi:phosphatidylglycerophosphate synthase
MRKGKVLPAENWGKYKTIAQVVSISLILLYLIVVAAVQSFTPGFYKASSLVILASMSITVALTLFSGLGYLWSNRGFLHASKTH